MVRTALMLGCTVLLLGCDVVGVDYQAPQTDVPSQFVGGNSSQLVAASQTHWWTEFNDPLLNEYIEKGSTNNLDIQLALERIRAAQAAAGRVGVNSLTSGALTASVSQGEIARRQNDSETLRTNANYTFDLFGGAARAVEQAEADIGRSQADVGVVRLAFLSQLINNYIDARYFQAAAEITRQAIQNRRETLSIVEQKRDVGESTLLEVERARANLAASEASLPILLANFHANAFAISTLLAVPADEVHNVMHKGRRFPRPPLPGREGLPADLLRNRPDIQSAERNLAARTAAIGVSEAQLYPSISIGGSVSVGTTDSWSFGPSLNIPMLNRGVLRSNLEVAESNARQAEIQYRQTVLEAIEEVQSSIVITRGWHSQLISQEKAERAARTVLRLSRESYRGGAITLTEVLDAERQLSSNQLASADALRNYASNWALLHIRTGQGWRAQQLVDDQETVWPSAE